MVSSTSWYDLKPCDAWFFRDGRPMNRGEDFHALQSLFPPQAPTVVGAFRAALARQQGWNGRGDWKPELKRVLGDGFDDLGQLKFEGPFLALSGKIIYPCPAHLLGTVADGKFTPENWLRPSSEKVWCDAGHVHLPEPPEQKGGKDKRLEPGDGFYLTFAGMQAVIEGRLPKSEDCVHRSELFRLEPRVGIARDDQTRTTGDGALFNPHFVRLVNGASLVVGLSGVPEKWGLPDLLPIGGEARLAQCQKVSAPAFPSLKNMPIMSGAVVSLLVTSAYFTGENWYGPGPGDCASGLSGDLQGAVITVAMERPSRILGWDSLKGHPVSQRALVTPGAVWWIEATSISAQAGSPISLGTRSTHGHGFSLLGRTPT